MSGPAVMKIVRAQGEILLSAADHDLLNTDLREGILHLHISEDFYGNVRVPDETIRSSLDLCTIANLVGKHVVEIALEMDLVSPENIIYIQGVPHAQLAKIIN
ncbi:MAG: hypothetical protein B2I17_05140 [Thermoplasmatales archaeon B_DKE]|nr:MAG: hypothetical protein B2I17_05140 [Thermoplasmatales archaeon B_DKE]QRF75305.1 hypothetical protein Thermo_00800 [Thermoplasmatales archaeon]